MTATTTYAGPRANREDEIGLWPAPSLAAEVQGRPEEREIQVLDPGAALSYRLGRRGAGTWGGFGWTEAVAIEGEERGGEPFACAVSEPFAVLSELGHERLAFEMTREGIRQLARGDRYERRRARSLLVELERAIGGERVGLRRLQAAIVKLLEVGETPAELAKRGGFVGARGAEKSRFLRRAGLIATPCPTTGKLRYARTASPEVAAMLCRACDLDPVEVGV